MGKTADNSVRTRLNHANPLFLSLFPLHLVQERAIFRYYWFWGERNP